MLVCIYLGRYRQVKECTQVWIIIVLFMITARAFAKRLGYGYPADMRTSASRTSASRTIANCT